MRKIQVVVRIVLPILPIYLPNNAATKNDNNGKNKINKYISCAVLLRNNSYFPTVHCMLRLPWCFMLRSLLRLPWCFGEAVKSSGALYFGEEVTQRLLCYYAVEPKFLRCNVKKPNVRLELTTD